MAHDFKLGKTILGFMYFVRFMSDQLTLDFTGLTQADCEIGFQEVQKLGDGAPGGETFDRITDTGDRRVTSDGRVRTIFH